MNTISILAFVISVIALILSIINFAKTVKEK